MSDKAINILLVLVGVIVILAGEIMIRGTHHEVRYDCRMVDVSPDMPEEVKRICRARR